MTDLYKLHWTSLPRGMRAEEPTPRAIPDGYHSEAAALGAAYRELDRGHKVARIERPDGTVIAEEEILARYRALRM